MFPSAACAFKGDFVKKTGKAWQDEEIICNIHNSESRTSVHTQMQDVYIAYIYTYQ